MDKEEVQDYRKLALAVIETSIWDIQREVNSGSDRESIWNKRSISNSVILAYFYVDLISQKEVAEYWVRMDDLMSAKVEMPF